MTTSNKKLHNKWERMVAKYLDQIVWCEICGSRKNVGKAHRLKRRFIHSLEEYYMAAKLCGECHRRLDEATGNDVHRVMFEKVTELIVNRDPGLVNGVVIMHRQLEWDYGKLCSVR